LNDEGHFSESPAGFTRNLFQLCGSISLYSDNYSGLCKNSLLLPEKASRTSTVIFVNSATTQKIVIEPHYENNTSSRFKILLNDFHSQNASLLIPYKSLIVS